MPPFRYEAFVNPYIGSISELMGKGDQAKAEALLRIGEIQARAEEQRGQAWGNAIQGLGNIASKAITDYNDPKAREARAIDKAQKILDDRSKQLVTGQGQRLIAGTLQPGSTSQEFVVPESRGIGADVFGRTNFGSGSRPNVTTDDTFALAQADPNGQTIDNALPNEGLRNALSRSNAFGPTERLPGSTSSVAQAGIQPNQRASSFGRMEERITPPRMSAPQVETYDKAPRNRYTTAQGLYDVRLAYEDLVKAGVSTKIAIALAGQGQQANSIFAAYDKDKEELDKKQIAVRGSIANMAIQLMDTGMSAQDALTQASGPAGNRISQDDMNAFAVKLNSQPTEQDKKNLFLSEVEAWDAQGKKQVVNPGDYVLNDNSGTSRRFGTRPVSAADSREFERKQAYDEAVANGYVGTRDKFEAEQTRGPASIEQQVLKANANGDTAEVKRLLAVETSLAAARRQPPDPGTIAAAGLTRELALARLRQYNNEFNATERSANTRKNLPDGFNAAFGRATLGMPATRRDNFDKTLEDIASRNDSKELLSFLRQAAIEGSPVEQQRLINARIEGVEALGQVKLDLAALRNAGIKTNIVRGGVENIAQALGTTSDPRLAAIAARITENLIIYRQAVSGAAFSDKETEQYEKIMPGFSNTFGLNEARIDSLLNAWTSREKSFWNVKLGGGWGSRMINDLSGSDLGANFGPG